MNIVDKSKRIPKKDRPKRTDRRPWLVGTDDIPPPMDVGWQMWSESSNPYEQGLVQFEFTPKGLAVQWFGLEEHRYVIEWHELAIISNSPPKFHEEMTYLREKAEMDGFKEGLERAQKEFDERTMGPRIVFGEKLKSRENSDDPPDSAA